MTAGVTRKSRPWNSLRAQDVGKGLASQTPCQEALQRRRLCGDQGRVRAGQEVSALQAQDVAYQDVGLQGGLLHARFLQSQADTDQGSACVGGVCSHSHSRSAGEGRQPAATACSSLRACSAADRASTRPSKSPSKTSGRLWAVKPMRWSVTRLWGKL